MELSQQHNKQLQALMSDPRWKAVEFAFEQYLKESFIQESIKRDTEFDTIWYTAFREGGFYHISAFFEQLELQARDIK